MNKKVNDYTFGAFKFTGNLVDGLPNGVGLFYNDDMRYEGEILYGCITGTGTLTLKDGNVYKGCFENGSLVGNNNCIIFTNGTIFTGIVKNLSPYKGLWKYSNGDKCEGIIENGVQTGVFTYSGVTYNGKLNNITGDYTFEYKNDKGEIVKISGNTKNNSHNTRNLSTEIIKLDNGNGKSIVRTHHDNIYYEGEFVDNKIDGYGTYTIDGEFTYTGYFKDNLPHGKGILRLNNGDIFDGIFNSSFGEAEGVMIYSNGKKQKGKLEKGYFHKKRGLFG